AARINATPMPETTEGRTISTGAASHRARRPPARHQDRPAARGRQDPLSPPWARTCQREEVGVYARAGSNDRFTEDGGFAAIALGDDATGFADEQEPGCQVPGLEVRVKEDVESARS